MKNINLPINLFARIITCALFYVFFIQSALGQTTPVNDECAGAINVPVNSDLNCLNTLQGTTVGATQFLLNSKNNVINVVLY